MFSKCSYFLVCLWYPIVARCCPVGNSSSCGPGDAAFLNLSFGLFHIQKSAGYRLISKEGSLLLDCQYVFSFTYLIWGDLRYHSIPQLPCLNVTIFLWIHYVKRGKWGEIQGFHSENTHKVFCSDWCKMLV